MVEQPGCADPLAADVLAVLAHRFLLLSPETVYSSSHSETTAPCQEGSE